MNLSIKESSNKTAILMLDNDTTLFTFNSVAEAIIACRDWYQYPVSKIYAFDPVILTPTSQLLNTTFISDRI